MFRKKVVLVEILVFLYIVNKKTRNFFDETKTIKKQKITKRSQPYKRYASTYNVETLKCFNPHLQPKDSESTSRNKSKDLLTELKGFKFVAILVLEFEK